MSTQTTQATGEADEKNPTIAALLSAVGLIIPLALGAGQIYNGQIAKGIALSIVQVINALLIFVLIGFITYPIVAVIAIYDAYKNAEWHPDTKMHPF